MDQDYLAIQQRVRHYWFKDGIGELAVGGLFFALSLYFAMHRVLPPASGVPLYLNLGLFIVLAAGVVATRKLITVFKMHITYPRTGYVEYHLENAPSVYVRFILWLAGILFVILLVAIGRWVGSFQWLPAFLGTVFGGLVFIFRTKASGLTRFNYHAALSILLGGGLSLISGVSAQFSLSWYYGVFGVWLMVWGAVILAKYLRENPLPDGGSDE